MKRLLPILLILAQAQAQTQPVPIALEPVQIVMDEVSFRGSKFNKIDKTSLLKNLEDMFQKAGFTVLPTKGAIPPNAFQVRFLLAAVHDGFGRVAYQMSARASEGKDAKLSENPPGQPQRVWFANITAARSEFEDGISEIQSTLANLATVLYRMHAQAKGIQTAGLVFPVTYPPPPASARINSAEFQKFTQVKIKSDGYRPPWPREALEKRTAGTVVVELLIGEDGKPVRAIIRQGPPELFLHAIQWAMGYEFEPASVDGKPVKARFMFNMNYRQDDLERYSIR